MGKLAEVKNKEYGAALIADLIGLQGFCYERAWVGEGCDLCAVSARVGSQPASRERCRGREVLAARTTRLRGRSLENAGEG